MKTVTLSPNEDGLRPNEDGLRPNEDGDVVA